MLVLSSVTVQQCLLSDSWTTRSFSWAFLLLRVFALSLLHRVFVFKLHVLVWINLSQKSRDVTVTLSFSIFFQWESLGKLWCLLERLRWSMLSKKMNHTCDKNIEILFLQDDKRELLEYKRRQDLFFSIVPRDIPFFLYSDFENNAFKYVNKFPDMVKLLWKWFWWCMVLHGRLFQYEWCC